MRRRRRLHQLASTSFDLTARHAVTRPAPEAEPDTADTPAEGAASSLVVSVNPTCCRADRRREPLGGTVCYLWVHEPCCPAWSR